MGFVWRSIFTQTTATERDKESKCFIHFSAISKDDEILITATGTLCKIVECRSRWIVLDGEAREVSERSFQYMNENEGKQLICDEADIRSDLFYHHKCYQKLTNKRVIEMAEKRVGSKEKTLEKTNEPQRKSRQSIASSSTPSIAKVKTKNTGILPRICIICKKKELYYNNKVSYHVQKIFLRL